MKRNLTVFFLIALTLSFLATGCASRGSVEAIQCYADGLSVRLTTLEGRVDGHDGKWAKNTQNLIAIGTSVKAVQAQVKAVNARLVAVEESLGGIKTDIVGLKGGLHSIRVQEDVTKLNQRFATKLGVPAKNLRTVVVVFKSGETAIAGKKAEAMQKALVNAVTDGYAKLVLVYGLADGENNDANRLFAKQRSEKALTWLAPLKNVSDPTQGRKSFIEGLTIPPTVNLISEVGSRYQPRIAAFVLSK